MSMLSQQSDTWRVAISAGLLLAFSCEFAVAQQDTPLESVVSRSRPSYDPLGARIGPWELNAGLDIGIEYSDNVLAATTNETDDLLTILEPSVGIAADWGRTSLALTAGMSVGRYEELSSEDFDDFAVDLRAGQRVGAEGRLRASLRSASGHDSRRDPTDEDGLRPNRYDLEALRVGFSNNLGAVDFDVELEARNIDYEDTPGVNTIIYNDDRYRRENRGVVRLGFLSEQTISTFVEYQQDEREYEQTLDDSGIARSSKGSAIGAGIRLRPTGKLSGESMLGHVERRYQSSLFSDNGRFWIRSALEWNPTGLTTLSLDYETRIEETTTSSTAGVETDEVGLRIDHELLRHIIVSFGGRASNEDYVAATRKDDVSRWFGSIDYLLNNNLRLSFEVAANDRDSSASSQSFADKVYRISLRTAL